MACSLKCVLTKSVQNKKKIKKKRKLNKSVTQIWTYLVQHLVNDWLVFQGEVHM